MNTLSFSDPIGKMFNSPGVVLWRSCSDVLEDPKVNDLEFELTDRGSWMGRCDLSGSRVDIAGEFEPTCFGKCDHGLVIFTKTKPPDNWTHLIVEKASFPMSQPRKEGDKGKGFSLSCTVPEPYSMDDFLAFKHELAEALNSSEATDFKELVELSSGIWIRNARPKEKRLFSMYNNDPAAPDIERCYTVLEPTVVEVTA